MLTNDDELMDERRGFSESEAWFSKTTRARRLRFLLRLQCSTKEGFAFVDALVRVS